VIRGVIEGFYGPPWSHEERLDLIAFCGREGLTTWVHAPKDDPYHRASWREPYPDEELAQLGEGPKKADAKALVAAIAREVGRLEQLSEEYLRVARLPSPRMEAEDVAALVRDVVGFTKKEMERASCTVNLAVEGEGGRVPPALFDEAQLRQALLNLLRNAREAMPSGGAIDVGVRAEGMSVVVMVEDRGSGISEEIRARVFDPFFSTKGEGTGLGLAITRQIVEAHGGTIACTPRDGGGTSFRIALPIAPARAT
jgi:signal transduction histidine kinase